MNLLENSTNNPNEVILTSLLKVFALLLVNFDYKQTGTGQHLVGLATKRVNYKQEGFFKIENRNYKDHILVFIKYIVFQHVGILWCIQTKETTEFTFEKEFIFWVKLGPW